MSEIQYSSAMLKMLAARENLSRKSPYFSSVLYTGKLLESEEYKTAWTNGRIVFFNPKFIEKMAKLDLQHAEFIALHEYLHKLLNHVGRRDYRKPRLWNMACDFSVNPIILDMGYAAVPRMLYREDLLGMTPEAIYEVLLKEKQDGKGKGKNKGKSQGNEEDDDGDGAPGPGDVHDDDDDDYEDGEGSGRMVDPSAEELEEAEAESRRMASKLRSQPGKLPGMLKAAIDDLFPNPKIDWKILLEDLAKDARNNTEKSWRRTNRRYASSGMIVPGEDRGKIFRLVVCFDVSGSITECTDALKEMKAETAALLNEGIVTNITLISTDTRITNREEVTMGDEVEQFSFGNHGGGTQFDEAMEAVGKVDDAVGCIFLTDMQTGSFGKDPGFPVIWVNWSAYQVQPPFGKVVPYKEG